MRRQESTLQNYIIHRGEDVLNLIITGIVTLDFPKTKDYAGDCPEVELLGASCKQKPFNLCQLKPNEELEIKQLLLEQCLP